MKKKTIVFTILLVFIFVCITPISVLMCFCTVTPRFAETYYGELVDMIYRLKNTDGNRVVIIGNSSVAFGVDSALLEEELQAVDLSYSVCNFGLYGSIGTKAMLELSRNYIRKGDIVVFSPEMESQSFSLYFSQKELWYALEKEPNYIWQLDRDDCAAMIAGFASITSERYSYFLSDKYAESGTVYAKSSFDERCDLKNISRNHNVLSEGYDVNNIVSFNLNYIDTDFIGYINEYYSEVKKKGAEMYYSFSPINLAALTDSSTDTLSAFYNTLDEMVDFRLISSPEKYILEKNWFYDSNFHLNESGMKLRTLYLAEDIKNELKIVERNKNEYPVMPELLYTNESDGKGDNSFADCFEYGSVNGGYTITSLNEKGKNLSQIVIPFSVNGEKIVSVQANVFQNNTFLNEIVFQNNISLLYDKSFMGCSNLKKIILQNDNPESVSVGWNLLDGTDAELYVPSEKIGVYLNNYFWGHYAGKINVY